MVQPKERLPGDPRLVGMVSSIIHGIVTGGHQSDAMHFISKDYQIITISRAVLGEPPGLRSSSGEARIIREVNRQRQQMLQKGELLATVATGWSVGMDGEAVCEYFPAPGQIETYVLSWPRPVIHWYGDPVDDPDGAIAVEAYREIWSIEELMVLNKHYGDGEEI